MRRLIITAMLVLTATIASAQDVKLRVSVNQATAPARVKVTVTIEPHAGNRKACLIIDGGEYHQKCWQVDAERHPRTEWFDFRIGSGGEYFAQLRVLRVDDLLLESRTLTDTQQFMVVEPGVPFVR